MLSGQAYGAVEVKHFLRDECGLELKAPMDYTKGSNSWNLNAICIIQQESRVNRKITHKNHEVVTSHASGQAFKYCRTCKVEVADE
jgi:hypothetical protein